MLDYLVDESIKDNKTFVDMMFCKKNWDSFVNGLPSIDSNNRNFEKRFMLYSFFIGVVRLYKVIGTFPLIFA